MSMASTAYVACAADGKNYAWHFTGVTAIEHSLTLDLNREAPQGTETVNSARNLPDRVTLSVIETDTAHSPGWSARMLEAMASLKRNRIPCRVVTSLGTYENMLLTEITATQDEENQEGWSGELVFLEYLPASAGNDGEVKTNTNSSVRENTGTAGNLKKVTGTALTQMLQRAGV
ncbi:phage baseplate protein [Aristaeella lactis]|uniref:Uncharacterized protein n=1 Tax=Aristaeella lactis TaxID=3046383 RepID=A0AC61PKR9_9FIRM|nr:hypothetical protein [Aristaeella lactis]QUA52033.1 hypothetical protein JYE50_09925 [Aristaeella lactis]SMC56855.1 hypothetical protein SAMN06297397_1406 [Aristaeella lactis]